MAFVNRQCSLQFVSLLSSTSFFKSGTDLFKGGKCAVIIAKQRSTRAFSDVISVYKYCEPLCVRSSQTVKYRSREVIKYHRSVRTRREAVYLKMYMEEKPSTNLGTSRSKILIFIFGNWRPKFIVTGSTFGLENVLSTSISSKTQEKEWKQLQESTTNTNGNK